MKTCRWILRFTFLVILYCNGATAQELSIGDTLPDCQYTSVLRYPKSSVRLSDFKGKILILALWRTTCGHSISVFSHLDSLQQAFGDKVMVLGISTDQREVIEHYLQTNIVAKQTRLPSVTDDTLLADKHFTFVFIPHMVVADGTGVIRAITYPEDVTPALVNNLLADKAIQVRLKKEIKGYDFDVPLYEEGHGRNTDSIVYSSVISHYLPGVQDIEETGESDTRYFYKAYNKTIPELYAQALNFPLNRKRIILEVKDASRFINNNKNDEAEWNIAHRWVYNLILPKEYPDPNKFALEDFNRFFGVRATVEKREVQCFVLVKKGKEEGWKSKGGTPYLNKNGVVTYAQNIPFGDMVRMWDYDSPLPLMNETGLLTETTDMVLPVSPAEPTAFRKQLQSYGFDLFRAEREIEVLVIREP